jgi:hypothetical protein
MLRRREAALCVRASGMRRYPERITKVVRKTRFLLSLLKIKSDLFTKTGSGQT